MKDSIFTVGHSVHDIKTFLKLLKKHGVTAVCDVRSFPYSRYNPHFNRESLRNSLLDNNIKYVFLGRELGARTDDPRCYEDGRVQYERLAQTERFKNGLQRVEKGAQAYVLALMCAEKEPTECHRTILVSRELERKGFAIFHILDSGKLESHDSVIARLIRKFDLADADLFMTEEDVRNKAYKMQANAISYEIEGKKRKKTGTDEVAQ